MVHTYRFKLTVYTICLLLFLTGTLALTYIYSRNVILTEAEANITTTAQVLHSNLELEENELRHYTEIVRDDIRIKEYMFMISVVGTNPDALKTLYERQFGWLPVERHIIVTIDDRTILGQNHKQLATAVYKHIKSSGDEIFYFKGDRGLELVTWAPIIYQDSKLGFVALTHILNSSWLEQIRQSSGGYLFIVENKKVLLSSLPDIEHFDFQPDTLGKIMLDDRSYRVSKIGPSLTATAPQLWYGVSEDDLLESLERLTRFVLLVILAGSIAVFGMGLAIFRNFSTPLKQLMQITKAVADGKFPDMDKSGLKNEIGILSNMFVEMLASLREKQAEIDKVHKELEESAITDALTSLYNRRYLQEVFPRILSQAHRENLFLSGILLDLDHFKQINDRYGHLGGDQCLTHVARILRDISRTNDYVFRIGGEEFFILSTTDTKEGGAIFAEKMRETIAEHPIMYKNQTIQITTSIGVSTAITDLPADKSLTHLLFHSDKAMYQAKVNGRNQIKIHTDSRHGGDSTIDAAS